MTLVFSRMVCKYDLIKRRNLNEWLCHEKYVTSITRKQICMHLLFAQAKCARFQKEMKKCHTYCNFLKLNHIPIIASNHVTSCLFGYAVIGNHVTYLVITS